jgi:integrase
MGVKVRERPKGSGVFWIFIDHNNRRKAKKIGTDEKLANEVAEKIQARLTLGDLDLLNEAENSTPDFEEYANCWLEDYIKPLRRNTTYERYGDLLKRYVYPVLGKKPIHEIKRGEIRNLLLNMHKGGLSRSMICLVRDVVSGPMNYAIDEEVLQANPVSGILRRLKLEREKKLQVEPMTFDEVDLFLETCAKKAPEYYVFFLCAFRTGMRLGELLGLHWGDVDWNGKFIKVQRSFKRGRIDKTKTGKDRRVDMSDQLIKSLKDLLVRRKREALKEGRGEPVEIIFHKNGNYISQNSIRNVFKRILNKATIRNMRLHDIRHTFASLLLTNGESPAYVKEQMGHSSIQITVDIYGHLIPGSNREAINRLDNPQPSATYPQPAKIEKL